MNARTIRSKRSIAAVAALTAAGGAAAHHSDSIYFVDDRGDPRGAVRIEGTVAGVRLINPHSEFLVAVEGDGGTETWALESDSWNELRTLGWTEDTIRAGDRVVAIVSMSRFHDRAGRLRDLLIRGASEADPARLFLEHIPDASAASGTSDAPVQLLERVRQCEGMVPYDPARERGEETLLCMELDAEALDDARRDLADEIRILR